MHTMDSAPFDTPILLLIYRRPDTTRRVLESIRSVRPASLYVAADGPRANVLGEAEKCAEARRMITTLGWDCDVHTLFREANLGCGVAVSSAITWFFEQVTEGIVLEDDCLPSKSFYRFAQELLGYYRDAATIMHIGGNSFQYGRRRGAASYYFSGYANIWGWASWRRAWDHYDFSLRPAWELRDTWDTQWQLSMERTGGIAIVPNVNLVRNIGFGAAGTHTLGPDRLALLAAEEMDFPLSHPSRVAVDRPADIFAYYAHYRNVRFLNWVWLYRLQDIIRSWLKFVKRQLIKTQQARP